MLLTTLIFLIATLAGGGLFVSLGQRGLTNLPLILAFGGSFIIGMCFLHLVPEAFASNSNAGIFVLVGFVIQLVLEFLSKGIEHGHHHPHEHTPHCQTKSVWQRIPWLAFLSLALHAALESMPVLDHHHAHGHEGHVRGPLSLDVIDWNLVIGLVLHKVPVAMVLMAMMVGEHVPRTISWLLLVVFGFSPSVGMIVYDWVFHNLAENTALQFSGAMQACVVGILLHIGTVVLFEAGEGHQFQTNKMLAIGVGLGLSIAAFS